MPKRYFDEDKTQQFKPGVISEELRNALGVDHDKLPIWIYRMRVLGYPPGWLKTAEVTTLSVFDGSDSLTPGCPLLASGQFEDGEIASVQYNPDSLIKYPGFNVPIPHGVYDDWHYLGMPPMMQQQQLKEALKTLRTPDPLPKIKRHKSRTQASSTADNSFNSSVGSSSCDSHSLNSSALKSDCEEIDSDKNATKATQNHESSNTNTSASCDTQSPSVQTVNDARVDGNTSVEDVSHDTLNETNTNTDESTRKITLLTMGSPMPSSSNPKKPPLEKWGEGMGELLYFENLPTSTGTYKSKMKDVISKIRHKQSES